MQFYKSKFYSQCSGSCKIAKTDDRKEKKGDFLVKIRQSFRILKFFKMPETGPLYFIYFYYTLI